MLDPACLFVPDRARALPRGSKEREFAALCLRLVWHTVFDTCPGLLAAAPPDGSQVLEPFLAWAESQGLAMDWSLHAHLLAWLAVHPEAGVALDRERVVELMAAAASRWALGDQSPDRGILIASALLPDEGLLAWKPPSLEEGRKVLLVSLAGGQAIQWPAAWTALADEAALGIMGNDIAWRGLGP